MKEREAAEDRLERLIFQFSEIESDVQVCLQRLEGRTSPLERGQCVKSTLRGMAQTIGRLEREIIEQMTILETLYSYEEDTEDPDTTISLSRR